MDKKIRRKSNIKYYAGIGSRETPPDVLRQMTKIANRLHELNYWLRSGGANGADLAFEDGAQNKKEIYLPWKGFNKSNSEFFEVSKEALELSSQFHPYWHNLKEYARLLHGRNAYQVLGKDLKTPSDFIICWTKGGKEIGGTAQAIRIAKYFKIKVYNLAIDNDIKEITERIY